MNRGVRRVPASAATHFVNVLADHRRQSPETEKRRGADASREPPRFAKLALEASSIPCTRGLVHRGGHRHEAGMWPVRRRGGHCKSNSERDLLQTNIRRLTSDWRAREGRRRAGRREEACGRDANTRAAWDTRPEDTEDTRENPAISPQLPIHFQRRHRDVREICDLAPPPLRSRAPTPLTRPSFTRISLTTHDPRLAAGDRDERLGPVHRWLVRRRDESHASKNAVN